MVLFHDSAHKSVLLARISVPVVCARAALHNNLFFIYKHTNKLTFVKIYLNYSWLYANGDHEQYPKSESEFLFCFAYSVLPVCMSPTDINAQNHYSCKCIECIACNVL